MHASHHHLAIRLTSLLGTRMVLTRFLPSVNFWTLGSFMASATTVASSLSMGTVMVARSLPPHLDGHLHLGVDGLALVVGGPGLLAGHAAPLGGVAQGLPQLSSTHVGREGGQHEQQGGVVALGAAVGVEVVD